MEDYFRGMKDYWNKRFYNEGKIWGDKPSITALCAKSLFLKNSVKSILIPGAGYGRNSKIFSSAGLEVTGIEVSDAAIKIAKEFDPISTFRHGSVIDMNIGVGRYDAIYCYNLLHLFRQKERKYLIGKFYDSLKSKGLLFLSVFSEYETSYGKGNKVEENTYESKTGRPVHYFSDVEIREQLDQKFEIRETSLIEEPERHGEEGAHIHVLRYVFCEKRLESSN